MRTCRRSARLADPPPPSRPDPNVYPSPVVLQILSARAQLPVRQFEEEIMATVEQNPVVIIRGATGCGKTTQVPQYILDRFVKGGRASDCNIVVTQVEPDPFPRL